MLRKEHTSKRDGQTVAPPRPSPTSGPLQPRGNAAAQDQMAADMTCFNVDTPDGERMICSEAEVLETPQQRLQRQVAEARDPDAPGERSDMECTNVGDRMICSETQILESPQERQDRELMEETVRNIRNDPFSLYSDDPMTLDLPDQPQPYERQASHEAGTRILDADFESDEDSIHPSFAVWEEYDDDAGRVGVITGDGQAGRYETTSGARRLGAEGRLELLGGEVHNDEGDGSQMAGPSVTGNAWLGDEGFAVGGGANLLTIAGSGGDRDASRADDDFLRVGGSAGAGFEFRGHWDDADGDGHNEYGLGFDLGPVSVDATSEDWAGAPGRVWDSLWD